MRYIKHHLAQLDGVAVWPMISLLLFFAFFVVLGWWVWRMRKSHVDEMASMPLKSDGESTPTGTETVGLRSLLVGVLLVAGLGSGKVLGQTSAPPPSDAAAVPVTTLGTHFGLSDGVWLVLLLTSAFLLTALVVGAMGILKNLIEHRAQQQRGQLNSLGGGVLLAVTVLSDSTFWGLVVGNLVLMGFLLLLLDYIRTLSRDLRPRRAQAPAREAAPAAGTEGKVAGPGIWERVGVWLNGHKPLAQEEDLLLNHAYDGIKELDNRLPPWWLYGFYLSIVVGVLYLFNYHILGYQPLSEEAYEIEMAEAQAATEAYLAQMASNVDERTVEFLPEPDRVQHGLQIFTKHCVACHAPDGGGGVGPNLTDAYWLHGGGIQDLFTTVKYGIPAKGMKSWRADLTPTEIQNVSTYILTLQGTTPAKPKEPQGELVAALP
ncbi:MAG: hypothetical protein RJA19_1447 [Bacteroidota bacterium]